MTTAFLFIFLGLGLGLTPRAGAEPTPPETFDHLVVPLDRDLVVTDAWGDRRPPKSGATSNHEGVDIRAREGEVVYAAFPGRITYSGIENGHCGNTVVESIKKGGQIVYCHLSQLNVAEGDQVGFRDMIGRAGSTGNVTAAHLHLQLFYRGAWRDPLSYMVPRSRLPRRLQ